MSSDTKPLGHPYHYYDPYYYSDWYYNTPGTDALGVVIFCILIFGAFLAIYWLWGDDEGCSCGMNDRSKKCTTRVKRVPVKTVKSVPPLAPMTKPKPSAPPAPGTIAKATVVVPPYTPVRRYTTRVVQLDTPNNQGWTKSQIQLVKSLNQRAFFDMINKEIIHKLKQRRNPILLAKQLIALRMQVKPAETNVILLEKYIDIGIEVIQASDIKKISKELRLMAIDIIARLGGYVNGWNQLPPRILIWVMDFTV